MLFKDSESTILSSQSPSKYFYPYTIFANNNDLFKYLKTVILYALNAMLLLNQQMYWLDWNQIEDPQIAEYKSNCNFLEANNHVNDIVYTKAKLISNINLVENAMFRSDHEYNCHEYHSYDRVLKDSIVKEGKKRYSLQELQTLFQNYYPYVYSLVNYWETKIPDKIYKDFTNKLNSDFEELCLNLSLKKHQINEKKFIFTSISKTLCKLLYSQNNIVHHWEFYNYENQSKYFF